MGLNIGETDKVFYINIITIITSPNDTSDVTKCCVVIGLLFINVVDLSKPCCSQTPLNGFVLCWQAQTRICLQHCRQIHVWSFRMDLSWNCLRHVRWWQVQTRICPYLARLRHVLDKSARWSLGNSSICPSIFNRLRAIARYWLEIATFPTPLHLMPNWGCSHWNSGEKFGPQKTRIMGLPGSEDSLMIAWAVSTQYQRVMDRQTDGWTDVQPIAIKYTVWLTHVKNYKFRTK